MTTGRHWVIQLAQSSFYKQGFEYLPYATGLLQAYVMRYAPDLSRYTFLPTLLQRQSISKTLSQIGLADVFAFSTYVWSYEYNLALAKAIKAHKPNALVIFGGPQVPDQAEDFLRSHPEVDVCVHGEGEITFFRLLESLPSRDWDAIPGVSWIDTQGRFQTRAQAPRQRELDVFPSPYLMGLFDHLVKNQDYHWVAQWETNRGCPFSCTFCDWGSNIASKVSRFGLERVKAEIEWFGRHKIHTINCCDANFGILPRDLEITDFFVEVRQRSDYPKILFVQGAKNTVERSYQINKKLIGAGLGNLVTLSLQSLNPQALTSIRRDNISLEAFRDLQARCQNEGLNTYTDYLVGLPGETYASFVEGVSQMISEGQHHQVNFFNVYVLPNAELNQPEYRLKHGIQTVRTPHYQHMYPFEPVVEVQEWSEMVIATHSFDRRDWVRMRAFAWWIEILYLQRKPMQIPLLLLHLLGDLSYRQIFEYYAFGELQDAPVHSNLQQFLLGKAEAITQSQPELCVVHNVREPYWLSVPDFVSTGLSAPEVRKAFYLEQQILLNQLLVQHHKRLPPGLLYEALALNEALVETYVQQRPFTLTLRYNLWEIVQAALRGQAWTLRKGLFRHIHDWVGQPFYALRIEEDPLPENQQASFKSFWQNRRRS